MSLQLYQTDDKNYLLDFQNLPTKASERLRLFDEPETDTDAIIPEEDQPTTHALEFFELCSTLIAVWRACSVHYVLTCLLRSLGND